MLDVNDPDWVPCQNLGYSNTLKERKVEDLQRKIRVLKRRTKREQAKDENLRPELKIQENTEQEPTVEENTEQVCQYYK